MSCTPGNRPIWADYLFSPLQRFLEPFDGESFFDVAGRDPDAFPPCKTRKREFLAVILKASWPLVSAEYVNTSLALAISPELWPGEVGSKLPARDKQKLPSRYRKARHSDLKR
jgi:hypothetical protein